MLVACCSLRAGVRLILNKSVHSYMECVNKGERGERRGERGGERGEEKGDGERGEGRGRNKESTLTRSGELTAMLTS